MVGIARVAGKLVSASVGAALQRPTDCRSSSLRSCFQLSRLLSLKGGEAHAEAEECSEGRTSGSGESEGATNLLCS